MKLFKGILVACIALIMLLFIGCQNNEPLIPEEDSSLLKGGTPLTAFLSGDNEVPSGGDPNASGIAKVFLNQGLGTVSFEINVSDLSAIAIAAHIHIAEAGTNGPVVVALTPPDETGFSSGIVTDVDRELIKAIRMNPENYYVNVHTAEFPAGAVRGQLEK